MDILSKYLPFEVSLLRKREEYLFVGLAAGILFFFAIHRFGPGITNDSVNYLSASENVLKMEKADGTPFVEWPPLFPWLLSIANLVHINTIEFATLLHGAVYIVSTLIMLYFFKMNIKSKPIYLSSVVLLIFSTPFIQMHVLIWSEPVFMLLIIINIILLHKYALTCSIKYLIILILTGCLMYLQRKTGIIFIISSSLMVYYFNKSKKQGLLYSVIYLVCCFLPVFWWYLRRYKVSGNIITSASLEPAKFFVNAKQFTDTFSSYFFPSQIPCGVRVIGLLILLIMILWIILKNTKLQEKLKNNLYFKISIFNILIYYSSLILLLIYIHIDDTIDDRILSPVFLPLMLCLAILTDGIYHILKAFKNYYSYLLFALIMLWLIYPVARTVYHLNRWNTEGTGGYNNISWHSNKLIVYLSNNPIAADTLYTNNIHTLKYFINFKEKKNYTVLPEENIINPSVNNLLICFEKSWNYPQQECVANKINNKKIRIRNKDGEIWQLNSR